MFTITFWRPVRVVAVLALLLISGGVAFAHGMGAFSFFQITNQGSTVTIDWQNDSRQKIVLAEDTTFEFQGLANNSADVQLLITNDTSADHAVNWPANVVWSSGDAPATVASNWFTLVECLYHTDVYLCSYDTYVLQTTAEPGVSDLVASVNEPDVLLSWSSAGPDVTYQVEYKESVASTWTTYDQFSSTTNRTVTGLSAGVSYDIRLAIQDGGNAVPPSNTVTVFISQNDPTGVTKGVFMYGQSLSIGARSTPAINTSPAPANLQMFNGGTAVRVQTVTASQYLNRSLPDTAVASLVPIAETDHYFDGGGDYGETPGYSLLSSLDNGDTYVFASVGRGALSYGDESTTGLRKRSRHYGNLYIATSRAEELSTGPFEVTALTWIHGHADAVEGKSAGETTAETRDRYKSYLYDLIDTYQKDVETITGQSDLPPLVATQYVNPYYASALSNNIGVSQAFLDASYERADIILAAPDYIFEKTDDNVHLTAAGSALAGEYLAKAIKAPIDFRPQSISASGTEISIVYENAHGGLTLDTTTIPLQDNYGFQVYDNNGNAVTLTSVSVLGDTVTLTTDTPVTAGVVRYAQKINQLGNLRNNDTRDGLADWSPAYELALDWEPPAQVTSPDPDTYSHTNTATENQIADMDQFVSWADARLADTVSNTIPDRGKTGHDWTLEGGASVTTAFNNQPVVALNTAGDVVRLADDHFPLHNFTVYMLFAGDTSGSSKALFGSGDDIPGSNSYRAWIHGRKVKLWIENGSGTGTVWIPLSSDVPHVVALAYDYTNNLAHISIDGGEWMSNPIVESNPNSPLANIDPTFQVGAWKTADNWHIGDLDMQSTLIFGDNMQKTDREIDHDTITDYLMTLGGLN